MQCVGKIQICRMKAGGARVL